MIVLECKICLVDFYPTAKVITFTQFSIHVTYSLSTTLKFSLFFQSGTSCGGLRKAIYKDFFHQLKK